VQLALMQLQDCFGAISAPAKLSELVGHSLERITPTTTAVSTHHVYYAPPLIGGALSDDAV